MRHEDALAREAAELVWRTGNPCDGGACAEIAVRGDEVLLRSSVAPEQIVGLSRTEWRAFLTAAKEGRFDHL